MLQESDLYKLPKDILIKLVLSVQEKTINMKNEEIQKVLSKVDTHHYEYIECKTCNKFEFYIDGKVEFATSDNIIFCDVCNIFNCLGHFEEGEVNGLKCSKCGELDICIDYICKMCFAKEFVCVYCK